MKRKSTKRTQKPKLFTDDGIELTPVSARITLGDIKIVPIQPPPFSRTRRRGPAALKRAATTSMPGEAIAVREFGAKERPSPISAPNFGATAIKIGKEDRVLITPTTAFPSRAICQIIVSWPSAFPSFSAGTGTLIGSRHVLTAGHVVYNGLQGGWAKMITVMPGRDGDNLWFGAELLVAPNFKVRSVKGWTEDGDSDYDYALITLNSGFSVGSFGLMYASDNALDNTTAYVVGYPGDMGAPPGTQQFGVPSGGAITDYDSTMLYHKIDTSKGQSGSAIYRFTKEGKRAIIGVHRGASGNENCGPRITKARHDQIRAWQNSDNWA